MAQKMCTMCYNGVCQRHPRQDHGLPKAVPGPADREGTLKKMYNDMIKAKLDSLKGVARMEEASALEDAAARAAGVEAKRRAKEAGAVADGKKAMGLAPVSESDSGSDSSGSSASDRSRRREKKKKRHHHRHKHRKHRSRSRSLGRRSSRESSDGEDGRRIKGAGKKHSKSRKHHSHSRSRSRSRERRHNRSGSRSRSRGDGRGSGDDSRRVHKSSALSALSSSSNAAVVASALSGDTGGAESKAADGAARTALRGSGEEE